MERGGRENIIPAPGSFLSTVWDQSIILEDKLTCQFK
jgi:hypothetical protein